MSASTPSRAAERSTEQRFQTLFDQAPFSVQLQLEAKGVTQHLRLAFAGEAVRLPAIHYDGGQAGFDHYLVKPADLDELARLVQHA
ncbi:hypothetical protein [Ramlibacter algicola]|uniref:Uncharacterized protein n=1 Tax=Ramlibacter algicola TaxID=2795217 RepID=A0A934URH6_9BURK|nr:hypothetical protein [Ramlibacter algicola]MBK0393744.1 hypothetical protein [Ramlibacter algicola]